MTLMLEPDWAAAAEAFIADSLLSYSLHAAQARSLGSRLMTSSFLENVMIQKLDHRSSLYSFQPASCRDAVGLSRIARA